MSKTEHYQLQKPEETKTVEQEIRNLQTVLDTLDGILHKFRTDLDRKASDNHAHEFDDINGLKKALSEKMEANKTFSLDDMSDVMGATEAAIGYILVKTAQGWLAQSGAAALGEHKHKIEEIINLSTELTDRLTIKAAKETYATILALADKLNKKNPIFTGALRGEGLEVRGGETGQAVTLVGLGNNDDKPAPFTIGYNGDGSVSFNANHPETGTWIRTILRLAADGKVLAGGIFEVAGGMSAPWLRITGQDQPKNPQDVATKDYVDKKGARPEAVTPGGIIGARLLSTEQGGTPSECKEIILHYYTCFTGRARLKMQHYVGRPQDGNSQIIIRVAGREVYNQWHGPREWTDLFIDFDNPVFGATLTIHYINQGNNQSYSWAGIRWIELQVAQSTSVLAVPVTLNRKKFGNNPWEVIYE